MKKTKNIFLFFLVLGLISCTEKVAKELEETTIDDPITPPAALVKSFKIDVEKFSEDDSAVMHLANQLKTEKCLVEATELNTNSAVVKDCVIDINEHELYQDGFKINIDVSENLCEYVKVMPYKFYVHPPGASTGSYTVNVCDEGCLADPTPATIAACAVNNPAPANACLFNHGDPYQCDVGGYTTTTTTYTWDEDNSVCVAGTPQVLDTPCDGNVLNCVKTPVTDPEIIPATELNIRGLIYKAVYEAQETEEDEDGEATGPKIFNLNYTFQPPIDYRKTEDNTQYRSNTIVANFAKSCSGVNPAGPTQVQGLNLSYLSPLGYIPYNLSNPSQITLRVPGEPGYTAPEFFGKAVSEPYSVGGVNGTAFASSSLRGIHAQPLYTVQCIDQAHDIKAEIRFVVKEWDRQYASSLQEGFDLITYTNGNGTETDSGATSFWNNYWDIDDIIENSGTNFFGSYCYDLGATTAIPAFDPDLFIGGEDL